jgi:hypothetical protein
LIRCTATVLPALCRAVLRAGIVDGTASALSSVSGLRALPTVVVAQGGGDVQKTSLPGTETAAADLRKLFNILPETRRFAVYRNFVDCNPNAGRAPGPEDRRDAGRARGMLCPAARRLRRQRLHEPRTHRGCASPSTTPCRRPPRLCAKYDGQSGRYAVLDSGRACWAFPLQRIFDLTALREKKGEYRRGFGAGHPPAKFGRTGGSILFPLMKFMYEYCTTFFDTRHLVIAVNPQPYRDV